MNKILGQLYSWSHISMRFVIHRTAETLVVIMPHYAGIGHLFISIIDHNIRFIFVIL